jgi:hypothetical protein
VETIPAAKNERSLIFWILDRKQPMKLPKIADQQKNGRRVCEL